MPREEFVKTALGYVGDLGEDVGEPGERIYIVEACGAEEAVRVPKRQPHPHAAWDRDHRANALTTVCANVADAEL